MLEQEFYTKGEKSINKNQKIIFCLFLNGALLKFREKCTLCYKSLFTTKINTQEKIVQKIADKNGCFYLVLWTQIVQKNYSLNGGN